MTHDPTKTMRCMCGKLATVRFKRTGTPAGFACVAKACSTQIVRSLTRNDVLGLPYPRFTRVTCSAGFTLSGKARTWR